MGLIVAFQKGLRTFDRNGLCVVGARLLSLLEDYLPRYSPILAMVAISVGCAYVSREPRSLHILLGSVNSFPPCMGFNNLR